MAYIPPAIHYIARHVLDHLASRIPNNKHPLFVAFQGPQGCGKTFLTSHLKIFLEAPPHSLRVAVLSIDDLYLPHDKLRALATEHRENSLWLGRGLPGTHDVKLGISLLQRLKDINEEGNTDAVELPVFDKSLHSGEGDRLTPGGGTIVCAPLDIVVLEGWCTGFYPVSANELEHRWTNQWQAEKTNLAINTAIRKEDIIMVSESLRGYIQMWEFFEVFVQITPALEGISAHRSPYSLIYKWRLEQEHAMKALNGGRGMSDDQVRSFVDRYIPGYVFFGDSMVNGGNTASLANEASENIIDPPWRGHGLILSIGEDRTIISLSQF